jgi:alpha,alpha-trehalose-phosphate synthase [UDP-forming]
MPDIARHIDDRTLILLSNREPYEHVSVDGKMEVRRPAGGLVSALDPTMQRTHGTWIAWGSGSGDRESADGEGRIRVPPEDPTYTLRRIWLEEEEVEGYYVGFANSALWPLCHMLIQHFEFRVDHWTQYQAVNRRFAEAAAEEMDRARSTPLIWIQDYHFALVASQLRELRPDAFIQIFWHIPFPPPDLWELLPATVQRALLRGLLGNDLVAFHTERYASNFLACVESFIPDAKVDHAARTVEIDGRKVEAAAFPISIDVARFEKTAGSDITERRVRTLRRRYAAGSCQLGVSVDRVDYTKGIPHRLRALELLWEERPNLREQFTFIQVAPPSRSEVPAYRALDREMISTVERINRRFRTPGWTPILLVNRNVAAEKLAAIYRAADMCMVSSLQDGMNLVAKEFIACQLDDRGVLVLSKFTGAAEEVEGAVLVNPFNIDGFVDGIRSAFDMPMEERRARMRGMRKMLRDSTIFDWLEAILSRAARLMGEVPAPR